MTLDLRPSAVLGADGQMSSMNLFDVVQQSAGRYDIDEWMNFGRNSSASSRVGRGGNRGGGWGGGGGGDIKL